MYLCRMPKIENTARILSGLGITDLNEMQQEAFDAISDTKEVLLLSPTGSGKTLAFLLPIFSLLEKEKTGVQCLIVTPTRELALQIEQVWRKMGTGFKVTCCYGGHDMATETRSLSEAPALLIGTPGRLLDHIYRKTFVARSIRTLVLDEFDKSLEMGFQTEMASIMENLPLLTKKILVSATGSATVPDFTGINAPLTLDFIGKRRQVQGLTIQMVKASKSEDKIQKLVELLRHLGGDSTMIFCNLRDTVESLNEHLKAQGMDSAGFHGKLEQEERERTLTRFRNGSVLYLVATDLAARGLDIPDMKHVIHFELPMKGDEFVHRNGRTARMQAEGTAYILHTKDEVMPGYVREDTPELRLPEELPAAATSDWTTVYISGGKKNKLSKMDIAGFLIQKGKIEKQDLGLIEVKDTISFVAVRKQKVAGMLKAIAPEKMKGKKYKIEIAR